MAEAPLSCGKIEKSNKSAINQIHPHPNNPKSAIRNPAIRNPAIHNQC